ncbi:MAG: FprA family A-type flavoprotein [Candidatus Bipolaricaulota bacterium]
MKRREVQPGVEWLGAVDWDRRLFDELIPLPDGTSYNAYLVRGEDKTALIDTADPTKRETLLAQLADVPRIDVVIVQHVEQDHSGSTADVLARYPEARVLASEKAKPMIVDHLAIPAERIDIVADRSTLSLGGRTLEFVYSPWVHWPETMLTYLREDRILFTCDLFGSHLATANLLAGDHPRVMSAAKRYYAEIMMPFASMIRKHLDAIAGLPIDLIAPSHGPIYDQPSRIVDAYRRWVNDPPKNVALIPYVSMHGSTAKMVDHLVAALVERGVHAVPLNLTVTDIGEYASDLVDAATVVFGTPTVLVGPHPKVVFAAYLTAALRPKLRHAAVIGSYGWGGKAAEQAQGLCASLKAEWLDSVFVRGMPDSKTFAALDALADQIAGRHLKLES